MVKKELFDDFGESMMKDDLLDVNTILSGAPGTVTAKETDEDSDEKKEPTKKSKASAKEPEAALDVERALADAAEAVETAEDIEEKETGEDKKAKKPEEDEAGTKAPGLQIDEKTPSSDAPFTVIFARDLNDRGLLTTYDEEKLLKDIEENGEAEAIRALFRSEIDSSVKVAKNNFETGYQEYLELVGKGVDKETASGILELKEYFEGINETKLDEDEALRKDVMTRYYKATTQLTDAKIEKLVTRSVDLGDDVEESKEQLQTIRGLIDEEIKTMKAAADEQQKLMQQEQQRQLSMLKEGIDNLVEIIPGQRINKQTKEKMYDAIIKPAKDKFGNTTNALWAKRAEDPMEFDTKLAYLLETGFFEKGKSWDKLKAVITTKSSDTLTEFLKNKSGGVKSGIITGGAVGDKKLKAIIDDTGSIL